MYVLKPDYKRRIDADLLNQIIAEGNNNGDDLLATVSKAAEDTISTLAGVLYDIAPEFEKAGIDRNGLLLTWAVNIATYEMYQRIDDAQVPEKVIKNYDDTMEDLVKVSKGQYPLNLPPKPANPVQGAGTESVDTEGAGLRRMGSQKKRTHTP